MALEHDYFQNVDPQAKEFLEWHCQEEIGHQATAYDVLSFLVPGNTARYFLRILGVLSVALIIFGLTTVGTFLLMITDPRARQLKSWRKNANDLFEILITKEAVVPLFLRFGTGFLVPSFHPATPPLSNRGFR